MKRLKLLTWIKSGLKYFLTSIFFSSISISTASKFRPLVLGFLPTDISTTSQSKLFLLPSLSIVETTAPDLLFWIVSTSNVSGRKLEFSVS